MPFTQDELSKILMTQRPGAAMDEVTVLELAAKAAGYRVTGSYVGEVEGFWLELNPHPVEGNFIWNSLIDDGDLFRLSVALGIKCWYEWNAPPELGLPRECAIALLNGKCYAQAANGPTEEHRRAAVRLAATRAAAAIGKGAV